ncbi:MAG: translocation/assembly module TamB domain-containing protein, partial [Azovibrio sp.]
LSLKREQLQLEAQGQLDGISPFPLQASLNLKGELEDHPFALELKAEGPLVELPLTGQLTGKDSQGNFQITLTPFSLQPFKHLQAQLKGINPADWQEGAPKANLDIDLDIHPLPEETLALSGQFEAHNQQPGRLDQGAIPLENLKGEVVWRGRTLEFSTLDAQLPRAARFTGKLALNLEEPLKFSADGQLANLNPAQLGDFPQANINGSFTIEGQVASSLSFNLEFMLRNSQILGKIFRGQGQLAWDGSRISTRGLQLNAGSNQLQARGALGSPEDSLQVNIRAPRLADTGLATGDMDANLQLTGALTLPQISGTATSKNLSIPNLANLEALNLEARMGTRPSDPLQIKLTLKKLQLPGSEQGIKNTSLQITGSRQQHQIQLDTQLALPDISFLDKNKLQISAKGNLASTQSWRGMLEQLQLTPNTKDALPLLSLEAPTPLTLGQSFHIGPAVLKGQGWQARLENISFQQNQWRSAGSLEKFPLARFFPSNNKSDLQISANWNISFGNKPGGQISIWRTDGDIMAGTSPLTALGLSLARLDINLDGEQLKLEAKGERLGAINGQLQFSGHDPLNQPWHGQLGAKVPDISWLSPLLGEAMQVGGNMEAQLDISGTPKQPLL